MKLSSAKRWTIVVATLLVLVVGGYFGGRHYVWPKIKAVRAERMNEGAREFLAKGDPANALLTARKILQTSKDNVEAWRIAVAAAKARETSEVIYYQDNLARLEPTKANYLELIRLSLRYNYFASALQGIKAVAKNASDDPEFHALAAQTYIRSGQPVAARYHLLALTQLKPSDRTAQLDLAELEMLGDPGRKDTALRARVRALADDPALRVRALSLLLRESIRAQLRVETGELVNRLRALPNLGINERLLLLEGSLLLGDVLSDDILAQLQVEVAGKPFEASSVIQFLNRTNQQKKVAPWFATLPEETKKNEEVRRAVGDALIGLHDWPAAEAHLKASPWLAGEFLRQAMLAYVYRAQARFSDFQGAWKAAIISTGNDPRKAAALLGLIDEWKWPNERYDVLEKIFALAPTNLPVRQALIAWERSQGKTANLNKIFARVVEVDPKDDMMRNNLAYTSLLLDSNLARAGTLATELATAHPENPFFFSTHTLALYKQGNAAEALARLESLSATELSTPERSLLHAVFLARAGDPERAADLLKGIDLRTMLPEEQRLAETAFLEIARRQRNQGDQTRMATLKQTQGKNAGAGGWLALLPAETQKAASVDMQVSDSLYATADWDGLQAALRSADWKSDDDLRLALLAYIRRTRDDVLGSRDLWTQALAAADRNPARVQNLQTLATQWNWPQERLDTVNILFERNPTDRALLAELLKHYRDSKRTLELLRVLTVYVTRTSDTTDEAVAQAYYSLIADENVARAHVLAKAAFEATPENASRRLVYAFSLWKQHRAAEANAVLAELKPDVNSELVPVALLRAAIQADLGQVDEARTSLAAFKSDAALPEESALAAKIAAQLAKAAAAKP